MNNEFRKIKSNNETRYVLETATAGATGTGAVATNAGGLGKVQKRNPDNILAQEGDKDKVPANKPRNFVAKNAKMGGAGQHKDKKKEQKQGKEKHRKPYMENVDNPEYNDEAGMAHSNLLTSARAVMGLLKTIKDRDNLPEWGQEKIAKAEMMLVSVWDYLQSQKQMGNDPQQDVGEGLRDSKDNPCWKGYKPVGTKQKGGRTVPNCVPKESVAEEQGYDEVSPKSASYILRKLDQGVPMSSILDDFPELGRMMEIIAGEQGLHPDDDFEQIEDILMNDLEDIAAQEDDFGDYDRDEEQPDEYMESLAQSLNSVLGEKAVSKAQQRFMGMVHAAKKGEKAASPEVAKVAKGMSKKDAKDFAATKHKGLPEKKKSKN